MNKIMLATGIALASFSSQDYDGKTYELFMGGVLTKGLDF